MTLRWRRNVRRNRFRRIRKRQTGSARPCIVAVPVRPTRRIVPMTTARTVAEDRQTLSSRLTGARSSTDSLFSLLVPEALYERPIPERHRLIFYLGHLEAFDWNLLAKPLGLSPFDAKLD